MKKTPDGEVVLPPRKIDQDKGRYGDPLPGDTATGATISPPTDDTPPGGITPTLPPPAGGLGPAPHVTPAPGTVADGHVSYVNYLHTELTPSRPGVRQSDQPNSAMRGRGTPTGHGTPDAAAALPALDPGALAQLADTLHNGIDQAGHSSEVPGNFAAGVRATGGLGGRRVTS